MMSKKNWSLLLCFHISYLFLGASIFYSIENPKETRHLIDLKEQVITIQNLIYKNYLPSNGVAQIDILTKLSDLCGEPMAANLTLNEPVTPIWDFYHAFFFSYTVISTIGYGNLAPTTSMGRIIMIFYALLGVPMNAILFANLGAYFATTFRKLYSRYKAEAPNQDIDDYKVSRFGLIGQIMLYLIPGVIIFIFVPACLFVIFEGWDYTLAVYYAFVTLTTIGFGDYVAAVQDNGFGIYFNFYKAFLIIWITFGLGYIGMCIGFLTQGLKSKKIKELEQKLSKNLRETQTKIWSGVSKDVGFLRKILNEITIMRYKPVYRDEVPSPKLHRSSSCPALSFDREESPTARRRAQSEAFGDVQFMDMNRTQSDSDLLGIDRKKTFESRTDAQPFELLARVVDALGSIHSEDLDEYSEKGIHGFSDSQILKSERMGSLWSLGGTRLISDSPPIQRARAISEVKTPMYENGDWSWTGSLAAENLKNISKLRKGEKLSMPNVALSEVDLSSTSPANILSKLNPFKRKASKPTDVEADRIMPSGEDFMSPEDYLRKTARGRFSMAPSSQQAQNNLNTSHNDLNPEDFIKKTSKRRFSMIPSSLQPQKLFSKSSNEMTPEDYLKKTSRGRFSMAPTPLQNDLSPEDYLRKTSRGRCSMVPTSMHAQRYLNDTRSGRHSRLSTTSDKVDILEQTTLADLVRAIEALHSGEDTELPKRKVGTVTPPSVTSPLITLSNPESDTSRRLSAHSPMPDRRRRLSITPSALPPAVARRRSSINMASANMPHFTPSMSPLPQDSVLIEGRISTTTPPSYSPSDAMRRRALGGAGRRTTLTAATSSPRPLRHTFTRTENIALTGRTRNESLPEIKIDKPTD